MVRPGDVYGPGSRPWTLLPLELLRARRLVAARPRARNPQPGLSSTTWSTASCARCTEPEAAGRVITLSGGVGVETRDYFGHFGRMAGTRSPPCPPRSLSPVPGPTARIARLRGAPERADARRRPLPRRAPRHLRDPHRARPARLVAAVGLDEGMARTEAWLREQGLI